MTEEEKGHLGIDDGAADHAQNTKGATIMRTNDTPNEGVITSYAQAPARTVTAGGVTFAYRELGPKGGVPPDKRDGGACPRRAAVRPEPCGPDSYLRILHPQCKPRSYSGPDSPRGARTPSR